MTTMVGAALLGGLVLGTVATLAACGVRRPCPGLEVRRRLEAVRGRWDQTTPPLLTVVGSAAYDRRQGLRQCAAELGAELEALERAGLLPPVDGSGPKRRAAL